MTTRSPGTTLAGHYARRALRSPGTTLAGHYSDPPSDLERNGQASIRSHLRARPAARTICVQHNATVSKET
jgi:hypothetical protein